MSRGFSSHSSESINNQRQIPKENLAKELKNVVELHSKGILDKPIDAYRNLYRYGLVDNILYINLALLEFASGNLNDAFTLLRKSIAIAPDQSISYLLLGFIARRLGDPSLSIGYLQKSLELDPDNFDALLVLSLSYYDCSYFSEALQVCMHAHSINSQSSELHANLSMIYLALGRIEDSKKFAEEAIKMNSDLPEAYLNLGNALHAQDKWLEAIDSHRKALHIRPNFSQALSGIGNAYRALGNLDLAETSFLSAVDVNPNDYQAYSNLAITKRDQGDLDAALRYCLKAIKIKNDSADLFINLGVIYYDLANFKRSEKAYRRAIELEPNNAEAQFSLATILLTQGDYKQGLIQYEWRFAHNANNPILQEIDGVSRWTGPDLNHFVSEFYILHEQGLGDSFQFIRFAPLLKKYAKTIYFVSPQPLVRLLTLSGIVDDVISISSVPDGFSRDAVSLPLMSIPRLLGVNPSEYASSVPYLKPDPKRKKSWARKIFLEKKENKSLLIVALNWQGNPDVEKEKMKGRSIPLEMLSPLASIPGVRFVSIQKGYGSEQLPLCSFRDRFVRFQSEVDRVWDFADIASLLECCDLVISSDTSAAHLAGAIGARLWIPLKKVPEWRWGAHGTTTPWYPTATLFRQKISGDWSGPVELMRTALEKEIMRSC